MISGASSLKTKDPSKTKKRANVSSLLDNPITHGILEKVMQVSNGTTFNPNPNGLELVGGFGINVRKSEPTKTDKYILKCFCKSDPVYLCHNQIKSSLGEVSKYKLIVKTDIEPNQPYSELLILKPYEVCTDFYTILYSADTLSEVFRASKYFQTKLVSFLVKVATKSKVIDQSSLAYIAKPKNITYTDILMDNVHNLSYEERAFISSSISDKVKIIFNEEICDV